jgi:hypothetical protein
MSLTNQDIKKISELLDHHLNGKLDEKLDKKLDQKLMPLIKDLQLIREDISSIKKNQEANTHAINQLNAQLGND